MQIDTTLNQLIQQIENPTLTLFSKTIAILLDPITLILISLGITSYLFYKNKKQQSFLLSITMIITGALIKFSKDIFQRTRPINGIIQETSYSLPSGHTTAALVFFGLLTYIFATKQNKTKAIITSLVLVLISAFTRIYLRVHWLTDIIAGLILGSIILTTAILIDKKFP